MPGNVRTSLGSKQHTSVEHRQGIESSAKIRGNMAKPRQVGHTDKIDNEKKHESLVKAGGSRPISNRWGRFFQPRFQSFLARRLWCLAVQHSGPPGTENVLWNQLQWFEYVPFFQKSKRGYAAKFCKFCRLHGTKIVQLSSKIDSLKRCKEQGQPDTKTHKAPRIWKPT